MARLPTLTPTELSLISNCSLQYHFWQETSDDETADDLLNTAVLEAIQYLHAAGGPHRINLPAALRYLDSLLAATNNTALTASARQMLANYHRQLRDDWQQIIAGNERLTLDIRLRRGYIRCQTVIHRLDREEDGGITVIKFITSQSASFLSADSIEATLLHALAAAAYPGKRPVRIKTRQLESDRAYILQLTEKQYRNNLNRLKDRAQAWLDGEVLARPGLHCDRCPYKYNGCPLYQNESAEETLADLPEGDSSATLSARKWNFIKGDDFDKTKTDP